jgi:exopolysaccharide production protein ExoZ
VSRIANLQALRAVAASAVVACHFNQVETMMTGHNGEPFPLFFLSGGVDLFFVISGFIMAYSSERLFAAPNASLIFLTSRLSRIVPLYWITTVLAIYAMELPVDWQSMTTSLLFIPHTNLNASVTPLNGVGWTLNFEMFFYVLFASVVALPKIAAIASVVSILAMAVAAGALFAPAATVLRYWSDPIILEFAMGIGLAGVYRTNAILPMSLRVAIVPIAVFFLWIVDEHMPPSHYRVLCWGIPSAFIVAATVLGERRNVEGRLAEAVNIAGDSSYALYLIHPLAGAIVLRSWPGMLSGKALIEVLIAAAGLTWMAAIAVHRYVEQPTTRFLQNKALAAIDSQRARIIAAPPPVPQASPNGI